MGHLNPRQMQEISYDDFLHLLYSQSDDYGFLNTSQIRQLSGLKVPVPLHVEEFLDFYFFELTKNQLNQHLEENVGHTNC